jgi:site-specific DNA-methyltransferase (adenine-specific)
MKSLDDKSIDMVLTDPPYGTTACKWDTVIPFEPMWRELKRITKGPVLLFGSEPFSSSLRISCRDWYRYDWVWKKQRAGGFPMANKRPLKNIELISVFSFKQSAYYPQGLVDCLIDQRRKSKLCAFVKSIKNHGGIQTKTNFPKMLIEGFKQDFKTVHPTQKPVPLLEYLIKTYTLEGETVLDFTMGSGSTGVACKNLNRKFIGIEKDQTYFDIAKARIAGSRPSVQLDMMSV